MRSIIIRSLWTALLDPTTPPVAEQFREIYVRSCALDKYWEDREFDYVVLNGVECLGQTTLRGSHFMSMWNMNMRVH